MGRRKAYGFAIMGAAMWGLIGLFVDGLYRYGFSPWEVVAIRVIASFATMLVYLMISKPELLKIHMKDSPLYRPDLCDIDCNNLKMLQTLAFDRWGFIFIINDEIM